MLKQIFNCSCLFFTLAILIIIAKYIFQTTREGWKGDNWTGRVAKNCKPALLSSQIRKLLNEERSLVKRLRFWNNQRVKIMNQYRRTRKYNRTQWNRVNSTRARYMKRQRQVAWLIRQHYIDSQWCQSGNKWYYIYSWYVRKYVLARQLMWRGKPYVVYKIPGWRKRYGGWAWMWKPPNKWIYSAIRWKT